MQPLFQSAFLQALGFAIANSLWQTALVWLVYLSVSHLLPLSSAARYRAAVVAQLISFAWFALTIRFYYAGLYNNQRMIYRASRLSLQVTRA
jgi:bla regulator protein BlaR1